MSKRKKSKIKNLEKLHKIIDDLYDSKIKESKRRRLSSESPRSESYTPSSESLTKKPDSIETKFIIHKKDEKITKPKTKQYDDDYSSTNDLYEVEKPDISKPEFLKVKPKEASTEVEIKKKEERIIEETPVYKKIDKKIKTKPFLEKSISEIPFHKVGKDKIVFFKEPDIDEIFRKTKRGLLSSNKIQMYKPITIFEMWAFTLILGVVAVSGLFLMRDWLFLNFRIYGNKLIPTFEGTQNIHIWFGFAFAVLGLFHLIIHIFSKKKDILPKQTLRDFKAFLHSGMYLIGLARRESFGNSGKFFGRQRIVYLAIVYILGLTTLTGVLYYLNFLSSDLALVHVIPAGLSVLVLLFHFLITIRKHDILALRCAFFTGKLPREYVRKNYPVWYKDMRTERELLLERMSGSTTNLQNKNFIEGKNNITNALFKFARLVDESLDTEDIKAFAEELNATIPPDKLQRIIELSNELEDGFEEEINQESIDLPQQSKEG